MKHLFPPIVKTGLNRALSFIFIVTLFTACSSPGSKDDAAEATGSASTDDGWQLLFDGKTTTGWQTRDGDKVDGSGWTVVDGVLMVHAREDSTVKAGDIMTTEQYSDFIFDWEWKMLSKGGNSGVKYFVKEGEEYEEYGPGLEYQILDDANHEWMLAGKMQPGDYHTLAALYELYPAKNREVNPLGEWNHSRIVAKGNNVEHWLNGVKVLEFERGSEDFRKRVSESKFAKHENFGEPREGYILLQDHGSKMAFRNIRIKPIE